MSEECLFCKIAGGRTPTEFVFENDTAVVFKDINPHAPVHLLVVPKKHIRSVNDLAPEHQGIIGDMIYIAKDMAQRHGVAQSGYKLLFNVEYGGGQRIFHLHLHLLGGREWGA